MPKDVRAVMKKMREKMALIMWIVAITFVGLMVLQWGANIMETSERKARSGIIGYVGKTPISMNEYEENYRRAIENAQRGGTEITDEIEENIRQQTWNDLVNRQILLSKAKELSFNKVGPEELYQSLLRNPPEFLRQYEQFTTDGKFDYAKYQAALKNPELNWTPVEAVVRSNLPFEKLQHLVQTMTIITPLEVQEYFIKKSEKVKVRFVKFTTADIIDFVPDTSEQSLKSYYQQNLDKYKQKESARVKYVRIPIEPTQKDSIEAKNAIYEVYEKLKSGSDFSELAREYSEDYSTSQNGGRIGYIRRGQAMKEFDEVVFAMKVGEFSAPFLTKFGWHIAKAESARSSGDTTEILVAHILKRLEPSQESYDSVRALADSIKILADSIGLDKAVGYFKDKNITVSLSSSFGKGDPIEGVGYHSELNYFCFSEKPGAIFRIIPANSSYYIYELAERTPAGVLPFDAVRDRVRTDLVLEQKGKEIKRKMEELYEKFKVSGQPFDKFFSSHNLKPDSTDYFSRLDFLAVVNNDPMFKAAAFTLTKENPLSPVVLSEFGDAYILELIDRIPADLSQFTSAKDQIQWQIYRAKQGNIYNTWFDNIKNKMVIKDLRTKIIEE